MADFESVFKGRRVCALEEVVVVKGWSFNKPSQNLLRATARAWGREHSVAGHRDSAVFLRIWRRPSQAFCSSFCWSQQNHRAPDAAQSSWAESGALGLNLTLAKEAKAFSVQVVPGVKPIMEVYSPVTSPPAPTLAFGWALMGCSCSGWGCIVSCSGLAFFFFHWFFPV